MKTYHVRTIPVKGQKRTTVSGVLSNGILRIGISTCSLKDQFIKSKGREIALGRALENPEVICTLNEDENPLAIFLKEAKTLCTDFILGEISRPKEKQILETV